MHIKKPDIKRIHQKFRHQERLEIDHQCLSQILTPEEEEKVEINVQI